MKAKTCASFSTVAFLSCGVSFGQTYDLTAGLTHRGFVDSSGSTDPSNGNYLTGQVDSSEYRSYFTFNLDDLSGEVVSAKLSIRVPTLPSYFSSDSSETILFRDVSHPPQQTGGLVNDPLLFSDIGSGVIYGAGSYDNQTTAFQVDLNFGFVDAINDATSSITIGAALASLSGAGDQYVFGNTNFLFNDDIPAASLELVVVDRSGDGSLVPEPSSAVLLLIGSLGLVARRRS